MLRMVLTPGNPSSRRCQGHFALRHLAWSQVQLLMLRPRDCEPRILEKTARTSVSGGSTMSQVEKRTKRHPSRRSVPLGDRRVGELRASLVEAGEENASVPMRPWRSSQPHPHQICRRCKRLAYRRRQEIFMHRPGAWRRLRLVLWDRYCDRLGDRSSTRKNRYRWARYSYRSRLRVGESITAFE